MRRTIASTLALTALLALAVPAWAAQGVTLSWDACGAAGVDLKSFACDNNTGLELLWPTFIPPAGITNLDGIETRITIQSAGAVMPSWWKFGTSDCHAAGANVQTSSTAFPASCLSPWAVDAVGGLAYVTLATDRAELRAVAAVQDFDSAPLTAGVEYAGFAIGIRHSKSTGTGACPGCGEGACLLLTSIALDQSPGHTPSQVVLDDTGAARPGPVAAAGEPGAALSRADVGATDDVGNDQVPLPIVRTRRRRAQRRDGGTKRSKPTSIKSPIRSTVTSAGG